MTVQIGYESLAERSGVTITSVQAAATNVAANAFDWLESDYWQIDAASTAPALQIQHASGQACDYVAFFAHDLVAATDEYRVRYSTDGAAWSDALTWTAVLAGVNVTTFPTQTDLYWRIEFRRDSGVTSFQPIVSVVSIGSILDVAKKALVGFRPPLVNGFKSTTSRSLSGAFLGRSLIDEADDLKLKFKSISPSWIRTNWMPFFAHAKAKPFFVTWDEATYPGEAAFCWIEKRDGLPTPNYSTGTLQDFDITCMARVE